MTSTDNLLCSPPAPRPSATISLQLETDAAEDGPKDALWGADLFSPKLPSMPAWGQGQLPEMPELFSPKLPEMPVDLSQVSLPPMPFQTPVPAAPKTLSPLEGALTERSKVPARNLHQEGWDFFAAQQVLNSHAPLPASPRSPFGSWPQARVGGACPGVLHKTDDEVA